MAASMRPDTLISSEGPPARARIRCDTVSTLRVVRPCGASGDRRRRVRQPVEVGPEPGRRLGQHLLAGHQCRQVAAHAHGAQAILWASEAGVDSIEHGSYLDDAGIAMMLKHGTYLVPTAYLIDWVQQYGNLPPFYAQKMKDVSEKQNAIKAIKAGVKVALGTDAAVYPHGLNAHELDVYVNQFGMTPLAAIQTGTVNAADLMGWTAKTGSLDPGKWADIIAVTGDPLADVKILQHVTFVMKAGVIYKDEPQPAAVDKLLAAAPTAVPAIAQDSY